MLISTACIFPTGKKNKCVSIFLGQPVYKYNETEIVLTLGKPLSETRGVRYDSGRHFCFQNINNKPYQLKFPSYTINF